MSYVFGSITFVHPTTSSCRQCRQHQLYAYLPSYNDLEEPGVRQYRGLMCSESRINDFHSGFGLALGNFLRCSASAVTRWSRSSWSRYLRCKSGCSVSSARLPTWVVGGGADFERTSRIFFGVPIVSNSGVASGAVAGVITFAFGVYRLKNALRFVLFFLQAASITAFGAG